MRSYHQDAEGDALAIGNQYAPAPTGVQRKYDCRASLRRGLPNGKYRLKVPYNCDDDLGKRMYELQDDISSEANDRPCFLESDARMEGADRHW